MQTLLAAGNYKMNFTSKADVLQALSHRKELGIPIPDSFTVAQWLEAPQAVLDKIGQMFGRNTLLAIRSSCKREDSAESSGAGAFLSLLNVPSGDRDALRDAIEQVIASYGAADPDDQTLVQEMIKDVTVSGVIMTRVLADGSPYYVINYDDESKTTDSVTAGNRISKTVYVYKEALRHAFDSPRLWKFVEFARLVEALCGRDDLDMEFCMDAGDVLHLLQVRPICAQRQWQSDTGHVEELISRVSSFVQSKNQPENGLHGNRTILGVMPDWNPAEMIGILPHPLASSLYRNLITSRVWSSARQRMGYRRMPSTELMLLLLGRPYIDVRASFNSFLPAGLDPTTCEALVSAWLERLESHPDLHDKIEFEIAQTALDFHFDEHLDSRYPGLLTSSRRAGFRECLRGLTAACLRNGPGSSLAAAMENVIELRNRHAGRPLADAARPAPITSVCGMLDECRKYGTLPFSILARHAFIAESLLRSAIGREAISQERAREFKRSIRTISGELSAEFMEVCNGRRNAFTFIQKYGHLRPGSYDISSPRYADRDKLFVSAGLALPEETGEAVFSLSQPEKRNLDRLLAENGLPTDAEGLLRYARTAIAGRELAKFVFSRNLSDALETIAWWARDLGMNRDDASHIPIDAILERGWSIVQDDPAPFFRAMAEHGRELLRKSRSLKLGYIIRSGRDVYIAPQHRATPNYIGQRPVAAETVALSAESSCSEEIAGKIVCIENADPGFDWIFTRGIAGLVTKFGGTNSHMSIRCAEYGLPAAIGTGERLFASVAAADNALLDPSNAILKAL